jgi:hypothetical protein
MEIKSIPLSKINEIDELRKLYDKVVPIGSGYLKYFLRTHDHYDNFTLVINTHNELNIHFIKNRVLDYESSVVINKFSLESLLEGTTDPSTVSQIIDIQLASIYESVSKNHNKNQLIIYLENSTHYLDYLDKTDKVLVTDCLWKVKENQEFSKLLTTD